MFFFFFFKGGEERRVEGRKGKGQSSISWSNNKILPLLADLVMFIPDCVSTQHRRATCRSVFS